MGKISKDKIDSILDISDTMKDFDSSPSTKTLQSMKEEEARKRYLERKEESDKVRANLEKVKDLGDERFIKEALKEITTIGLTSLRQMQDEMTLDPTGRMGECMSAMANAVTAAVKQLGDVENDKTKLSLEKRKVDLKEKSATAGLPNGNGAGNVLIIGSMSDALKAIRQQGFDNMKEVQVEVDKEIVNKESPGTLFKEDS
jgi:ribosomal protein S13